MWKESKELEALFNKFAPYLVEQPDGTADFPPGTPQKFRDMREEYTRRSLEEQIAAGEQ